MGEEWSPFARRYNPLKCGSIDGTDDSAHDKGVIRALKADYRPDKQVKGDKYRTVFVARLNRDTTEESLTKYFATFGKIRHCRLVRDIVTGMSKGYAFIEYKHKSDAEEACRKGDKAVLEGYELFVDFERERTLPGWIPRRLGGGFGGRKESGQLRFGGRDRPFKKPIFFRKPESVSLPYGNEQRTRSVERRSHDRHRSRSGERRQRRHSKDGRHHRSSRSRSPSRYERSKKR
ncbi:U11/U12 small nuclear ribonucleoprotein 35 kDa protein-like [Oscarella lobularis]|uniref:U11/U12 small nuclear ribonucleoprotein 35 kDa protein-like n=1 Tax=Oscarella lobularis TaxID=121494 RepID=UPI003313AAFE